MARKVSDRADEEAQREEEVAPIVAQPNEFVPVAPVSQDAFFQAQQQAQISGADSDTVPQHMVEAANRGRLARGEEPVVVGNVEPQRTLFALRESPFGEMDGVGE